jgi:hypothetical protein
MDAVCVVSGIQAGDISIVAGVTRVDLRIIVSLKPVDNSVGVDDAIVVTRDIASSAQQWRNDIIAAVKAWAQAPPTAPAGLFNPIRIIGLVDLSTLVP